MATRALPGGKSNIQVEQEDAVMIIFDGNDRNRATLKLKEPLDIPKTSEKVTYFCTDPGRHKYKTARIVDAHTIILEKLSTSIAKVPAANIAGSSKPGGFLARNNRQVSEKSRMTITVGADTYAAGDRADKLGGNRQLGQEKTVDLLPRILMNLTLHGIKEGTVNASIAIPFKGNSSWPVQEEEAAKAVRGERSWKSESEAHKITMRPLIVPENYYAALSSTLTDPDAPDWKTKPHIIVNFGHQTADMVVFGYDPYEQLMYFDQDLSRCFDGHGMSKYYGYVAEKCGYSDPEDSEFIEAVNNNKPIFIQQDFQANLSNAIEIAHSRYLNEIVQMTEIPKGFTRIQVVGGGAYRFGQAYCDRFPWAETFVPQLPDWANVIGQALSLPTEFATASAEYEDEDEDF